MRKRKFEKMTLILGTSSIFRRKMFREHFKDFILDDNGDFEQFISPDIDEKAIRHADPSKLCQMIAEAKCEAILKNFEERKLPKDSIILTFDQVVVCNGQLREKPVDKDQATEFLKSYADGQPALALSGVVAHNVSNGKRAVLLDKVTVTFTDFSQEVIEHLIDVGEIFHASGSFTIDDRELGKYVQDMDDTIDAIEGLPIEALKKAIYQVTTEIKFDIEKPLAIITHVLFDMDGLLLDTEVLYTIAQQKVLDQFEIKFTPEVKAKMMGRKALEGASVMIEHYGIDMDPQKFIDDRNEILAKLFPNCDLMPGALRLLRHFKKHNVPMAVATSSTRCHFNLKITKHKALFDQMFDYVVTGDDVEKSKPDPEIFVKAAQKYDEDIDPSKVLVFEDAVLGVEAANAAKMNAVWVYDQQDVQNHVKAEQKIKSLFYFKPELFHLPKF